jgi:hypothetical protein
MLDYCSDKLNWETDSKVVSGVEVQVFDAKPDTST